MADIGFFFLSGYEVEILSPQLTKMTNKVLMLLLSLFWLSSVIAPLPIYTDDDCINPALLERKPMPFMEIVEPPIVEQNEDQDRKLFLCSVSGCLSRFVRKEHLTRHQHSHSKEKKYHCECGFSCVRQDNLFQHHKTHLNPHRTMSFKQYLNTLDLAKQRLVDPSTAEFVIKAIADTSARSKAKRPAKQYFMTARRYADDREAFKVVWQQYCNRILLPTDEELAAFPFDTFLEEFIERHKEEDSHAVEYAEQAIGRQLQTRKEAIDDIISHCAQNEIGVVLGLHIVWDLYMERLADIRSETKTLNLH
jgi:hypothetical protein